MSRSLRRNKTGPQTPADTTPRPGFDPDAALRTAIQHHQAGRLGQAEALYRQVLKVQPQNADALHLLGVIAMRAGRPDSAVDLIRRAIATNAHNPAYVVSLANALRRLGRHQDVIAVCRDALDAFPNAAQIHYKLGSALRLGGEPEEAAAALGRAIEVQPNLFEAHWELGDVLKELGRFDEAEAAYHRAAAIRPQNPGVHSNLAALYLEQGDPGKALRACEACLQADPANRMALAFKAVALNELGDDQGVRFLLDFDRFIYARTMEAPAGFAGLDAFNAALAEHVCAHPTLHLGREDHSTRLGSHTENLLAEPPAGAIKSFVEVIVGAVEAYLDWLPDDPDHPYLARRPTDWRLVMWGNVLEAQGYQAPHLHPDGWVSGVYYVELHEEVGGAGQEEAGWIEFGRPISEFVTKVEPMVRRIRPEVGRMLLFPSYFYHRTLPFESGGRRISLAFDFVPAA
ncbi:MAG: tetratricopeptide repeat protein [Kiloniellales bacterium]